MKSIPKIWRAIFLILIFLLPFTGFTQLHDRLQEMTADKKPEYENYEQLILEAADYVFSNPVDRRSVEFISATQIVAFWMGKDTGVNIPSFGSFFTALSNEDHQQFLYTIAMIKYGLDQKIRHNRLLKCEKIKRQKYSEQEDVREVQLEGAKILMAYIGDPENKVPLTSETRKYMEAWRNNNLEAVFFEE